MKRLAIAAALALAIPAFAAEQAEKVPAQPQPAEKAATAPQKPAQEKIAAESIPKEVTLEAAPKGNAEEKPLRFERWAREAEDEPYETEEQWNAHKR